MADTIYKEIRKSNDMTRDDVCDKASLMNNPIQPERLERIENGKFPITPDEVMLLAEIYGEPTLCNRNEIKDLFLFRKSLNAFQLPLSFPSRVQKSYRANRLQIKTTKPSEFFVQTAFAVFIFICFSSLIQ